MRTCVCVFLIERLHEASSLFGIKHVFSWLVLKPTLPGGVLCTISEQSQKIRTSDLKIPLSLFPRGHVILCFIYNYSVNMARRKWWPVLATDLILCLGKKKKISTVGKSAEERTLSNILGHLQLISSRVPDCQEVNCVYNAIPSTVRCPGHNQYVAMPSRCYVSAQ